MNDRTAPIDDRDAANDRPVERVERTDTAAAAADQQQRVPVQRGDDAAQRTSGDVGLLPPNDLDGFRGRWEQIQIGFVDQPREAVQSAHDLVDSLVDAITRSFAQQRDGLESTWSRGADVSTEDLRLAFQRYRSLFNRLLST